METKNFTEAMKKLFSLIFEEFGSGHPILEDIMNFADIEKEEETYTYNDSSMFYLVRDLMNWDLFWVTEEGKIDVENANNPEVAELLVPFVTSEIALKVLKTF